MLRTRFKLFLVILLSCTSIVFTPVAHASRNGTEAKNSTFAVGFSYIDENESKICSGSLISPQIIATAAHCVINSKGGFGHDYIFLPPGVPIDAAIDPTKKLPKIAKFYLPPNFKNNNGGQIDDISFIQLDAPLSTKGFIKIANSTEILALMESSTVSGYGFGAVYETKAPYSQFALKYSFSWDSRTTQSDSVNMLDLVSQNTVACSGDSGGPITAVFPNGEEKLIAVLSGTAEIIDSCGGLAKDGFFHVKLTLINPFLHLLGNAYNPTLIFAPTKITKVTCLKGKTKKVISGVNPKCPTGYKKVN